MCCRMCNIVKAIHHCYKKYDTDQFIDRIFLNMHEGYDFVKSEGQSYGLSKGTIDTISEGAELTFGNARSS